MRRPKKFHAFLALAILSSLPAGLITSRHLSTNAKPLVNRQQDVTVMSPLPIQTNPARVREQDRLRIEVGYRNLPFRFEPNRGQTDSRVKFPDQWLTNIHTYSHVRYQTLYPGLDLIFHGDKQELEYDLIVFRSADSGQVKLGASMSFAGPDFVRW